MEDHLATNRRRTAKVVREGVLATSSNRVPKGFQNQEKGKTEPSCWDGWDRKGGVSAVIWKATFVFPKG